MSEIPASAQGGKSFSEWQPIYAERGITLIPCSPNKAPLVKNPQKFGRKASREIADEFSNASAFGYYCGKRNGITVLDVDTTDERVLSDAMYRHGQTPIVVRTGSGKFHALYRHNNERRSIRAWDGHPIDLLGAGLAIAPPSLVASKHSQTKGQYQIIQGHLDDLDRLPIMRELEDRLYVGRANGPRPQRQGEGRNNHLWRRAMREAHHVDDYEQLLDRVETLNQEFVEPMQQAEVTKIAKSAWGITERGDNRFGRHGGYAPLELAQSLAPVNPDALALYITLRAHNGPDSVFPIANAMADSTIGLGWRRFAVARKAIIEQGLVIQVTPQTRHKPAFYRWPLPWEKEGIR